jgi:putative hemolysin
MPIFLYTIGVLSLTVGLTVFSYLDRVYRELGRLTTGRIHEHLQAFESEIEPRLKMSRRRGAQVFSLLARLWLVLVAAVTARGVIFFVPSAWEAATEMVFFLGAEVIITMQFFPSLLLAGSSGDWLAPFIPVVRIFVWIIRPIQGILDLLVSVLHVSEEEPVAQMQEQQSLEDFVDAATQEGIIEQDEARMIEQVVEFSDKRVRDVMTARPDVVAIRASATLEALSALVVERKFSRSPV